MVHPIFFRPNFDTVYFLANFGPKRKYFQTVHTICGHLYVYIFSKILCLYIQHSSLQILHVLIIYNIDSLNISHNKVRNQFNPFNINITYKLLRLLFMFFPSVLLWQLSCHGVVADFDGSLIVMAATSSSLPNLTWHIYKNLVRYLYI